MLKTMPTVFAVGDTYQIMVPVTEHSLMWVKVGEKCYYDESNGVMRSLSLVHRMTVPMQELNDCGKYIICEREIIDRKPYFPKIKEVVETEFEFFPVTKLPARAYEIADSHNDTDEPVKAAKAFGDIDFLIMNGDIFSDCAEVENFNTLYDIAARITKGTKPVVLARGNHDLRGLHAEEIADYTPNMNGNTYYTFRLGPIWGLVLDCGEDKPDTNAEYGGTVCCHPFRERQTEFIKDVIKNAEKEYLAEGITHRLVVVHNPFTYVLPKPFDIERNIYSYWATLLKNHIKPDIMITGHLHDWDVTEPGGKFDNLGQPCTLLIGSKRKKIGDYFAGAGLTFSENRISVNYTDSEGAIHKPYVIELNNANSTDE